MSFQQNLKRKMEIDRLTRKVRDSLAPAENGPRLDKDAMRQLLEAAGYQNRVERETELFSRDFDEKPPEIIVLDSVLAFYRTDPKDVLLRKSPTLKEMISIRNAIRILNDKNVVVSRKTDTLMRVHTQCVRLLDLRYNRADIVSIADQGVDGLESATPETVAESLEMFVELLDLRPWKAPAQMPGIRMWTKPAADPNEKHGAGDPVILFQAAENRVQLFHSALSKAGGPAGKTLEAILTQGPGPDLEGKDVFEWLAAEVLENPEKHKPIDSFTA
jgi:hypothetical protein